MWRRRVGSIIAAVGAAVGAIIWTLWPGGPLLDTSAQIDDPGVRRAMGLATWSNEWAIANVGNELQWLDLTDPELGACTTFRVPPLGDRDYNLFNFAVCDGCEFGLAGFQSVGSVVFRIVNLGGRPSWAEYQRYAGASMLGAATWQVGADQYLLAAGLLTGGRTDLYRITGVTPAGLELLQVVTDGSGQATNVDGGVYLTGAPGYLWTVAGTHVHQWRVTGTGSGVRLTWMQEMTRAGWVRGAGIALDADARLLAATSPLGVELWSVADPEAPVRTRRWNAHPTLDMDTVALRWPYLWVAAYGGDGANFTHTYDVSDPAHPAEVAQETWADTAPAQQYANAGNMAALILPDYRLLVARWSVLLLLEPQWEPPPAEVFADGFEDGTTEAWSVTP